MESLENARGTPNGNTEEYYAISKEPLRDPQGILGNPRGIPWNPKGIIRNTGQSLRNQKGIPKEWGDWAITKAY